ncbi:MAG TPA: DNA mismatch repair protein MutS, partial [Thermoanaerobaculia bacterium]|nr:DNA mismatch repair protein MutS [Thermoanaerobaculia bacterium]
TSEWTFDLLTRYDEEIGKLAAEYGLDTYPNQIEVISAEQMMDAYSSIGMPLMYRHWSFGKRFARDEAYYKRGMRSLAYELVINSDPCISYIMEENSMTMQALVIAHAAYGHNHFFKNNYQFQLWTQPDHIIDYLGFAKTYVAECEERHGLDAVEELLEDPARLEALAKALREVPDLPRLLSRLAVGTATPREVAGLATGLVKAGEVAAVLKAVRAELLRAGGEASPAAFPSAAGERARARLAPEPPPTAREGGIFRDSVDAEVDRLRALRRDAASLLTALEAKERAGRGIPTLRVKFNQVFGHLFEVPGSARAKIPGDALKRQTLAAVERYATPELVDLDERLRSADAKLFAREAGLFAELVASLVEEAPAILGATARLAMLDAFAALARVARAGRWVRPRLVEEPALTVSEGRHPVVEALRPREPFVPNDASLGGDGERVVILTGPNMGGKSTYLRQNAILVLLAHVGSFVPAASATVGLTDRIFTRVGASDSLVRGESTFLVEMAETAHILRHATARSLVLLDEIGRGTSTFDGLSLAWAIAERLHDGAGGKGGVARVLFATHYHELTELALVKKDVTNRTMTAKEWNGDVVFLRKVADGTADRSYGVQVARLAGIPEPVLERAREILHNLERQQLDVGGRPRLAEHAGEPGPKETQLDLFRGQGELILDAIGKLDLDRMTPLAALQLLATFRHRLRGEE